MGLTLVLRALPPTWGRSRSTPKGPFLSTRSSLMALICAQEKYSRECEGRGDKVAQTHLLPENLGGVPDTTNHTHSTRVGHRCGELWARCDVHT